MAGLTRRRSARSPSARALGVRQDRTCTIENTVRRISRCTAVAERGYEALTLLDVDGVKKLLGFAPAGVFMLLHEQDDICTVPENDIPGAVTQLMVRAVTGQVGAYLEYYEFQPDGMLMGVPDYVPTEVVDGPVRVLPTAFGEFGEGLLNVSKMRTGPMTLVRLALTHGRDRPCHETGPRYVMHLATGRRARRRGRGGLDAARAATAEPRDRARR